MAINFKGGKYTPANLFWLLCWLLIIAYASLFILRLIMAAMILSGSLILVALPPLIIAIASLWIVRSMVQRGFGILSTIWLLLVCSVSGLTTSLWLFQGVDNVWIQGTSITSSILCLETAFHKPVHLLYRKLRFLLTGDERRDP
jgi:uncharacterized membrane protein